MVFSHDEPLASRNMRSDPFHKVVSTLLTFNKQTNQAGEHDFYLSSLSEFKAYY